MGGTGGTQKPSKLHDPGALQRHVLSTYLTLRIGIDFSTLTFSLEAARVLAFSVFWLVKSYELHKTGADEAAAQGAGLATLSRGAPNGRVASTAGKSANSESLGPGAEVEASERLPSNMKRKSIRTIGTRLADG